MSNELVFSGRSNPDLIFVYETDLPDTKNFVGERPDADFLATVVEAGVLQPIVLCGGLVADGQRRIMAERLAVASRPSRPIPAIVYGDDWPIADVMRLISQNQRRPNVAADVEAIRHLLEAGFNHTQIRKSLRIKPARYTRLKALLDLHAGLYEAMKDGKISAQICADANKLTEEDQEQLYDTYLENGKLQHKDLAAVRRARRGAQASEFFEQDEEKLDGDYDDDGNGDDVVDVFAGSNGSAVNIDFHLSSGDVKNAVVSAELLYDLLVAAGLVRDTNLQNGLDDALGFGGQYINGVSAEHGAEGAEIVGVDSLPATPG